MYKTQMKFRRMSLLTLKRKASQSALLLLSVLLLGLSAVSCATKQDLTQTDKHYYDRAVSFMDSDRYLPAIEEFNLLKTIHPLSPYIRSVELELISANYALGEYDETEYLASRYIEFYPDAEQHDFAYFMLGRAQYAKGRTFLDRFKERDLTAAKGAYASFSKLLELYPDSPYVLESQAHMRHIRNVLAQDELVAAQFYLERFGYVAAIQRSKNILQNFPNSPYNLEALKVLEAAYRELNWDDQADLAAKAYQDNLGINPDEFE